MRLLADQNFYEVLEVSRDASLQEIERAYRICRATYEPNSVATYSIFSEEESAEILRRIEEAYTVLSDARLRREYDARLRREEAGEPVSAGREASVRARPRDTPPPLPRRAAPREAELGLDEPYEPDDGIYDGTALRRFRLSRGIELEEISHATKINSVYLEYVESNRYHELPPAVYLRGFLKEYAKFLRLDPNRVADSYMQRYRERTGSAR